MQLLASTLSVAFVVQLGYAMVGEEPYPALMMPGFGWAGPEQVGEITISRPEIQLSYADGKIITPSQTQLFNHVPDGHYDRIMSNLLSPLPATPPLRRALRGKMEPPEWLFPGYNLAHVSRTTEKHVASLKDWLRGRAKSFYSAAAPERCSVTWYAETHRTDSMGAERALVSKVERTGEFEVDLHEVSASPR